MASGVTNRGRYLMADSYFRGATPPVSFKLLLCTATTTPTVDTNVLSDLEEIADGNGYTQGTGISVARDGTDWDVLTEDDTGDLAHLELKDEVFTASGGPLPSDSVGARWAVLGTLDADPQIICWWDLGSDRVVSDGQPLTLQDSTIELTTP